MSSRFALRLNVSVDLRFALRLNVFVYCIYMCIKNMVDEWLKQWIPIYLEARWHEFKRELMYGFNNITSFTVKENILG